MARRFFAGVALCLAVNGCTNRANVSAQPEVAVSIGPSKMAEGILFTDVAKSSGLDYVWPKQKRPMRNLEAFGKGCAFLDYDNDGFQDILLVAEPSVKLYRNLGNGRFEDVSATVGLDQIKGPWTGVAVGDYNGDGYLDLALTGFHRLALLKNDAGTRFVDDTAAAGFDPNNHGHWGSSAGFMDLTGKGTLDLVILNYVIFGPQENQYCELRPGVVSGCPPSKYKPEFCELWQNLGNGKFKDVTAKSGMGETHGKGLVLAFADVDDCGRPDFYIGNDGTPAELMRNQGNLKFKNTGEASGVAFDNIPGHAMAAMGADWADYDRDGKLDLAVPGFSDETYAVFHSDGGGLFQHVSEALGITGPTLKPLGFGTKWLDMDNDGWPDLVFTNGHVYDNAELIDPLNTYRQPLMLFHNVLGKQLLDLVPKMGGEVAKPLVGRGLATGDFDNDGRIDILVVDFEGPVVLLHNMSKTQGHWITLDLKGRASNRFAYGARVTAKAGKDVWVGTVSPTSSYLSSSDPRVHFGLGAISKLESVAVRWPSGKTELLRNVAADQILRIQEGAVVKDGR